MADVTIKLNTAGVRELLRSEEVRRDLEERAQRMAEAAGEGFEASSSIGTTRAHATVRTASFAARKAEATDRALTRAIDAGRG